MKNIHWTMQDSARQNAQDTCKEEKIQPGTETYSERFQEMYKATLDMLRDAHANEYYDEETDEYLSAIEQVRRRAADPWWTVFSDAMCKTLHHHKQCLADPKNPCWDGRPTDVVGKHWGGGEACCFCQCRAALFLAGYKN